VHNEEEVIQHVCDFLGQRGATVSRRRGVRERGIDIEGVTQTGIAFGIEAKGGTATKEEAPSFGGPFKASSVYGSVNTAYFCASVYRYKGLAGGMAFPDTPAYRKQLLELHPALKLLAIEVFWVQPSGQVKIEGYWPAWYADVT
jgi:hypothetical protein